MAGACEHVAPHSGLPALSLTRLVLEARAAASLPPLPTTALHGALPRIVRSDVCLAPARETCRGCPAERTCAYPRLFDPAPAEAGALRAAGVTDEMPRPLFAAPEGALVPTGARAVSLRRGDTVALRIGLAGSAAALRPVVVQAVRRVGVRGLGGATAPFRFDVVRVEDVHMPRAGAGPKAATMELLTPLRLKFRGRVASAVTATMLVEALCRRATLLAGLEGREWAPPFDPGAVAADLVLRANLQVRSVRRFSHRQGRSMQWPGLLGTLLLAGRGLAPLWPLLRWGEGAQIGKATTFGFGRYRLGASA